MIAAVSEIAEMERRRVRRLAAIFVASVTDRQPALEAQIASHRGRVVKTTGDGLLAEFASLVDAADCACSVQRLELGIGINLGDVIIDGGDMFGDGVDIGTWLASLARPAGVCVSKIVMDQLRDRRGFAFDDLGEHSLKDIDRPIHAYRLSSTLATPDRPAPQVPVDVPADHPSIAVLPFANRTGDAAYDYFAEGIAQDIITVLSQSTEFFVMAVRPAAQEPGVRYVLEGSVCRADDQLRVTSRLIAAANRVPLWDGRVDGAIDDVFGLQDRITETVAGALAAKVRQAEMERTQHKAG
jgi:adenylate cyclase